MKYCAKCGNANTDEAVFCSSCGTPLSQAPAAPQPTPASEPVTYTAPAPAPEPTAYTAPPAQPQPPVYTAPTYSAPAYEANYTAPAAGAPAEVKNKSTLWLILNIVATVLCCPGGLFSIIGIVFAALGMGSFNKGDYEDMNKKTKISMIMFIIGVILGLIGSVVIAIMVIASANYY